MSRRLGVHPDFADLIGRYLEGKHQKLTINAGNSCPNRDGTFGREGCTYCNNRSFSPAFASGRSSIAEQIEAGKRFFARKYPQMRYLAYFQSYTATHGSTAGLIDMFSQALEVEGVDGLVIGTRPDCMPDDLLKWLSELSRERFVMIEYGAESSHDRTLRRVNRCHEWKDTVKAVSRTAEAGIPAGLHLIMGLPGESREDMLATVDAVNRLPVDIIKCHQLQIIKDTRLAAQYEAGEADVTVWTPEEYLDLCVEIVGRLRPDIAIERLVSQAPADMLIAPKWGLKNYQFTDLLINRLTRR